MCIRELDILEESLFGVHYNLLPKKPFFLSLLMGTFITSNTFMDVVFKELDIISN